MPLSTLDQKSALIVVDLQNGIVGINTVHPVAKIIANAAALATAFRAASLPVVLVTVEGGAPGRSEHVRAGARMERPEGWADIVPELDRQPTDHHVVKRTWGAFMNTDLHQYLTGQGVTEVVVVGISSSAGVESTVRQAHEHGYNVAVATDAITDGNADSHANSVERIFPRIGETGTTAEIIELLASTRA